MREKRFVIGLGIIAVCSMLFAVSSSFMWFDSRTIINLGSSEVTGSSDAAYYASGQGTKVEPYIINQPRHLYNLAWLQYLGTYNKDTNDDGSIDEVYFKVEGTTNSAGDSVLDMDGWVLPPIGTEENPFVGNFNGNNTIIKNLTVSNTFSDYEDNHPYYNADNEVMSESKFTQPKIIGFFGVIGALDSKTYEYTSNIAVEGAAYTDANLVYDTYVDNITIENNTENQELLAGLLAGYVNAPIIQSGVGYGEFDFADGTTNLSSTNTPTGATINGVSNYSLIGAYNPKSFDYTGLPTTDGGSSDGQGNDFGGSIDMLTFARRISYIKNSAPSSNNYHATFGTTTNGGYSWLSTSTYTDLNNGSYLPVNIDMNSTEMVNVAGKDDTSNSYYSSNTEEPILKSNSGYITGGLARTRVQFCNKDSQGIRNVVKRVSGTSTGSENLDLFSDDDGKVISKDKLKTNIGFLTYYNGNVCAICDDDDKDFVQSNNFVYKVRSTDVTSKNYVDSSTFKKYSSVKTNFLSMIYDSTNAFQSNDGSKAYGVYLAGVRFQQWTADTTFNANVEWLGENKTVKFHNNGVQFELKKDGYLTAIVSKYDTSGNFSFYNLYSLDNLEDANLTKINTIHKDSNGNITYNESNDNTKVFDFAPITTTDTGLYSGQLYYFEIPIKKGIYFLSSYGSSYSSGYYPYLLYLDIGANAGDSGSEGGDEPSETSPTEIDFVYYDSNKKLVKITSDGNYVNSKVVFQIDSSASGIYAFNRTTSSAVLYYQASEVITVIGTGTATAKNNKEDVPENS